MAMYNGNQAYGAPTPALRANPVPRIPAYPGGGVASALASGYNTYGGARQSFTNPYDSMAPQNQGSSVNPTPYGPLKTPDYPTPPAPAPWGTPTTYTPQQAAAPAPPAGFNFDLSTDPILQQMQAHATNQRAVAESNALKERKQLAINYGDTAYGSSLDAATGQAAGQNPFSVLANLQTAYGRSNANLEESLNQHNLFYGGARIKALGDAVHDYQGQQAQAAGAEQTALGGIDQNRIAALMAADQSEQGAFNDAYSRALQIALAGGIPTGTPTGTPTGAPTDPNALRPPKVTAGLGQPLQAIQAALLGAGYGRPGGY